MAFLQLPIDAHTAPFEKADRRGSTLSEASTADSSRRGSFAASEASDWGTVMIPLVSGEMLEVSLIALEKAEQDLRELLRAHGSMNIRNLGQKYSAAHGVNFTKAVGITLAGYLYSAQGAAFVVESGFAPDKKGKALPVKDLVSIRREPAPTPRTASKRTLESALATVTQAKSLTGAAQAKAKADVDLATLEDARAALEKAAALHRKMQTRWADMTDSDEDGPGPRSEPEAEKPASKPEVKKRWADIESDDEEDDFWSRTTQTTTPKEPVRRRWADIESDDEDEWAPASEPEPEASPRPSVSAPVEDDEWTTVPKKGKGKKALEPPKAPWAKPVQGKTNCTRTAR